MIWLGQVSQGRDNNFNLIRMVAACAVLLSHAWPLTEGPGTPEPLQVLTGYSLGTLAVQVFFGLSGFFISASFAGSKTVAGFVQARILRLFPGLAVSLILVAFVLGPLVTSQPLAAYLTDRDTWLFLLRNITLFAAQYTLPGVFESNPYPEVEGSIWTLIQEVMCYGLVFLAGVTALLRRPALMNLGLAVYAVLWLVPVLTPVQLHPKLVQFHDLSLPFVMGMAFWQWRNLIPLSLPGIAGLSALSYATASLPLGQPALVLLLTYGCFWLGHVPTGAVRRYNDLGDYSYGVYIYAFPVQGLVVWLFGAMTPVLHSLIALPPVLLMAVLSWHCVESPVLRLRHSSRRLA